MNRAFLILLALIACLPARGQDNPSGGTARDSSGFLPMTASPPTMAPLVTNRPAAMAPGASTAALPTIVLPDDTTPPTASTAPTTGTEDTNFPTSGQVA